MRYSKDHKAETHARIVRNASMRLRVKGTRGVGVADLMKEAGLTHGGFYAHFGSREDLVIEAVAQAMEKSNAHWRRSTGQPSLAERLRTLVDGYLTLRHRDDPGHGCAIPSLAADIVREGGRSRRMFAAKIDEMIEVFLDGLPEAGRQQARQQVIGTLATVVGSIMMARVAGQTAFSNEILEAGQVAGHVFADMQLPAVDGTARPARAPRSASGGSGKSRGRTAARD
jgi:TetR/AcrR family transcriptional repressor of nem operon